MAVASPPLAPASPAPPDWVTVELGEVLSWTLDVEGDTGGKV